MGSSHADQLRQIVCKEAESLSNEAVQSAGRVSSEQVEALECLTRVLAICDQTLPQKPRKRWPVAVMLGISLVVVSIVLFFRLPGTEIELDLQLTDLGFVLSKDVLLSEEIQASILGVTELREIRLPRAQGRNAQTFHAPEGHEHSIRLSGIKAKDSVSQGTVSIRDLLLPAETQVRINSTHIPNQYRVSLEVPEGNALDLQIDVHGMIHLVLPGTLNEQLDYSIPRAIHLYPASRRITFDLTLLDNAQETFSSYLPSRDLAFLRIEEYRDTTETYIRRIQTVLSGTLYFAELNGRKYSLRAGEGLQFEASDGHIRSLTLKNDQLAISFYGHVRGMTTGWDNIRVNLMPTCLEWLRARHGLSLLWGTTLFLFGLLNRMMKWWKG